MEAFEFPSDNYIKQLLMISSNEFFELDLIPTWLDKKCQAQLIKVFRNISNISLKTGLLSQSMGVAPLKCLRRNLI